MGKLIRVQFETHAVFEEIWCIVCYCDWQSHTMQVMVRGLALYKYVLKY